MQALKKPKLGVAKLKVGMAVEARYEGGGKFLAGKITRADPDDTYEVEYQNGDVEQGVKKRMIRVPGRAKTKSKIPQKYAYAMRPDPLQFVPGQLKPGRRNWSEFKEWGYNINSKGEAVSASQSASRMSQPESEQLRNLKIKMRVRFLVGKVMRVCLGTCYETALIIFIRSRRSPAAGKVGV